MKIEEKDFKDFIKENVDCPETIYKMAKTPYERAVAWEFLVNQKDRTIIKEKLNMHDKILWAILSLTILAILGQYIQTYLIPLV